MRLGDRFWWRVYPELEGFTKRAMVEALRQCRKGERFSLRSHMLIWGGSILAGAWVQAQRLIAPFLLSMGVPAGVTFALAIVVLLAILFLTVTLLTRQARRIMRRLLREMLAQMTMCKNCGYNLTGNRSGVCPECGEKI